VGVAKGVACRAVSAGATTAGKREFTRGRRAFATRNQGADEALIPGSASNLEERPPSLFDGGSTMPRAYFPTELPPGCELFIPKLECG